jgi:Fe-S-cluster-containing hydrogenase component 2
MDTEELEDKLFQKADSDINQFLDLYLSGHARKNPTQSSLKYKVIATLFRKIVGNMFGKMTVNDSCTSCGKCVQICPVNAIEMKKGIPKINSNCQGCARCIVFCPNKAMELMKSLDFNTRVLDDAQLYESIEGRRG